MFKKESNPTIIPFFCVCLIAICLFIIPLKIIAQGYLPVDDALRHAAKVISGNNWDKILVLSDQFKMDTHPGWHSILGLVHKITHCNQLGLVIFSVVILFFILSLIPIFFLELPETWLFTLLIISLIDASFIRRLLFGRPLLFTITILLCICFLWPKLKGENQGDGSLFPKLNWRKREPSPCFWAFYSLTALITACVWIHGAWYLFILPIICFFLAGERRAGLRLSYAMGIGTFLGAALCGQPLIFLQQNITQALLVFGNNTPANQLVFEFQPIKRGILSIIIICGILMWGYLRGAWNTKKIYNPVFLMAILGWFLGFLTKRLWWEWGIPALCVWMAEEFQVIYKTIFGRFSLVQFALSRLIITLTLVIVIYSNFTNNQRYHWTDKTTAAYQDYGKPEYKKLLPEPGGIIYNDDMAVFYQTFFRYPNAPWRYILGFESSWMPLEDRKIFRNIQQSSFSSSAYLPWVKKMKPEDRLILTRAKNEPPKIANLEWHYIPRMIWVGRLPKK